MKILFSWLLFIAIATPFAAAQKIPAASNIDAAVHKAMTATHAKGLAIAVIDKGKVGYVHAYGVRNVKGDPLTIDTVMYGASLTKAVFAYNVMRLVDESKLKLDTPIKDILERPLASYDDGSDPNFAEKYGPYKGLTADPRWEKITPRLCLTHSTGLRNFWFAEPDRQFHIHFEPGSRYSYSGDGFVLLQFAIEHGRKAQGLGISVGDLTKANFDRMGMARTGLIWRDDFASNLADGWDDQGKPEEHDQRSKVRASGSMDTTISDLAKFTAALVRGDGLSTASRAELTRPQLHITTAHQFPLFLPELPVKEQRKDLYAGLGVVVFDGPQGHGFFKGGHNEITANTMVCLEKSQRCVLILSNDVRAEAAYAELVRFILGETGVPYDWEYGDRAGKS
ncbi:MAG TPA: serine hydrolase domain-containing protein [Terriglobales bacterium]|jgi:CubicO group peptidase (beta-lactamase class C family)